MPRIAYESKRLGQNKLALIGQANRILQEYAEQGYDLTLRQLYYQFVARDILPNVAKSYDQLGSAVNDGRMNGLIDWDHIVDRTRNLKYNPTWESPAEVIAESTKWFRIDKWANQPVRPEVWIEKDALIGVIEPVCRQLDVGHFSCRGYTSQSEMWAAANRLRAYMEKGQRVVVLHLGDHDPSGVDMTRDITDRLETFIWGDYWRLNPDESHASVQVWMEQHFKVDRIALTWEQIEQYEPPPNPAKITDSRATAYIEKYGDKSWELDALDPGTMSDLIRGNIEDLMDHDLMDAADDREAAFTEHLEQVSSRWPEVSKALKLKEVT